MGEGGKSGKVSGEVSTKAGVDIPLVARCCRDEVVGVDLMEVCPPRRTDEHGDTAITKKLAESGQVPSLHVPSCGSPVHRVEVEVDCRLIESVLAQHGNFHLVIEVVLTREVVLAADVFVARHDVAIFALGVHVLPNSSEHVDYGVHGRRLGSLHVVFQRLDVLEGDVHTVETWHVEVTDVDKDILPEPDSATASSSRVRLVYLSASFLTLAKFSLQSSNAKTSRIMED